MPKVNPEAARGLLRGSSGPVPDFTQHPATRPPYNREPYVRANIDGQQVDGKAIAWTTAHVQVKWVRDGDVYTRWALAGDVRRIERDESAWQDPYDELPDD